MLPGATGKDLVKLLLEDSAYSAVAIFVRRPSGLSHPRLTEILTDLKIRDAIAGDIKGDVLFSCLGTTLKAAGSKDRQWHIDYEIPLAFTRIAKANGVGTLV